MKKTFFFLILFIFTTSIASQDEFFESQNRNLHPLPESRTQTEDSVINHGGIRHHWIRSHNLRHHRSQNDLEIVPELVLRSKKNLDFCRNIILLRQN